MYSLNPPPPKRLLEAEITNRTHARQWHDISNWYCQHAHRPGRLKKELNGIKTLARALAAAGRHAALELNILLLLGDINYRLGYPAPACEYYATALMRVTELAKNKLTFHSQKLSNGVRQPISWSAARFQINKAYAGILMRAKNYPGVIKATAAGLTDNPNTVGLRIMRTIALMRTQQPRAALDCAAALQEYCEEHNQSPHPDDAIVLGFGRAACYHELGDKQQARAEVRGHFGISLSPWR